MALRRNNNELTRHDELINPSIEFLERLHKVDPKYLDDFMEDSRDAQKYVQKMNEQKQKYDFYSFLIGHGTGLTALVIVLLFLAYLINTGQFTVSIAAILGSLSILVGLFIYSKKK